MDLAMVLVQGAGMARVNSQTLETIPPSQPAAEAAQTTIAPRPRAPQYGYHNTFHLHAVPCAVPAHSPPTYEHAISNTRQIRSVQSCVLPRYKCTVSIEGQLGVKCELVTPLQSALPQISNWLDVFVELRGTQLRIYRLKASSGRFSSKARDHPQRKLLTVYSLQHAEVGIAADVKKVDLVPKSAFAKLIPPAARQKVFETDPHLFEPLREFVLRLRVENEQILLSAQTQEEMLDWIESIAMAIDIAMPIEDRSEPKYRSLPRRARRQREAEGRGSGEGSSSDPESRQGLVQQQERLFRELYPHLAADHDQQQAREQSAAHAAESSANVADTRDGDDADPDAEDLDRADALVPSISQNVASSYQHDLSDSQQQRSTYSLQASSEQASGPTNIPEVPNTAPELTQQLSPFAMELLLATRSVSSHSDALSSQTARTSISADQDVESKAPRHPTPQLPPGATLRYRRRCAPVLLASAPRASDILLVPVLTTTPSFSPKLSSSAESSAGQVMKRVKIDICTQRMSDFEILPPKYDAHNFPRPAVPTGAESADQSSDSISRPGLVRGDTAVTILSTTSSYASVMTEDGSVDGENALVPVSSADSAAGYVDEQTADNTNALLSLDGHYGADDASVASFPSAPLMSREASEKSLMEDPIELHPAMRSILPMSNTPSHKEAPTTSQAPENGAKKSKRLSLHEKILEKRTAQREQISKRARPASRVPIENVTSGQDMAFAALMF